jgi:hypothetical protein
VEGFYYFYSLFRGEGSRGCALIFFLLGQEGQGNGQGRGCQGFFGRP